MIYFNLFGAEVQFFIFRFSVVNPGVLAIVEIQVCEKIKSLITAYQVYVEII